MKKTHPLWSFGRALRQLRVGKRKEPIIVIHVVEPVELELELTRRDVLHMAVMLGLA